MSKVLTDMNAIAGELLFGVNILLSVTLLKKRIIKRATKKHRVSVTRQKTRGFLRVIFRASTI